MRDAWATALLSDFLLESRERMDHLEELFLGAAAAGTLKAEALAEIRLELHTRKGNAGLVGLTEMQAEAHCLEDLVSGLKPGEPPEEELLAILDRLRGLLQQAEREDSSGTGTE